MAAADQGLQARTADLADPPCKPAVDTLTGAAGTAGAVLVAVLTIYFLADLPRLQRGAVLLFPRAHRDRFARIAGEAIALATPVPKPLFKRSVR